MDFKLLSDLFQIGLHPMPLVWDPETKQGVSYPEHKTTATGTDGRHTLDDAERWFTELKGANAIALKLYSPYFMFDFDLKNSEDKTVYDQWLAIVSATNEDALRKVCIERTRSGGYHVYAKSNRVDRKRKLASAAGGEEVVSIYTGGLLSFCSPTPGYDLIHNDFTDIDDLTDDEMDAMVSAAVHLNKYVPTEADYVPGEPITYPQEYESQCLQFDNLCTDELWSKMLTALELYPVAAQRNKPNYQTRFGKNFYTYLRKGSTAAFSAKVRFDRKRLYLFSGSFPKFPSFHTRLDENDRSWWLTPTRVIYYSSGKDWQRTAETISRLCFENNIRITLPRDPTPSVIPEDRLRFPYDIFPEAIQQFINCQVIQHEYLAGSILGAVSAAVGNSAVLYPMPGYRVKGILYMALVAPPGASKSPALNKAFAPLERLDNMDFVQYEHNLVAHQEKLDAAADSKGKGQKAPRAGKEPELKQIIIKDSTIEMVAKVLSYNKMGCCILADELVGFLNRMNQYKAGDEVQKWLELWSGSPLLVQRITRAANKVRDPYCTIVGGIQPGVLESLSKEENAHNGFYHRFLFVYPVPQVKAAWQRLVVPEDVRQQYDRLFEVLTSYRQTDPQEYTLHPEAEARYKTWFDSKNGYYNRAQTEHVKGIIAKYQDYCLRFALLIQLMHDDTERGGFIDANNMERAIRLTEYFLGNMQKAMKLLAPDTPADKLTGAWADFWAKLPEMFTAQTAIEVGLGLKIKPESVKTWVSRAVKNSLIAKLDRGKYEKIA